MNLICIIGDSAVGKMTVGEEIVKLNGYALFHNHMAIELSLSVFKEFKIELVQRIRKIVYEEAIKDNINGLIITLQLPFDVESEMVGFYELIDYFVNNKVNVYIVELDADIDVRLKRNKTENRLLKKESKRDLGASEARLIKNSSEARFISKMGEVKHNNFIQIDNTNLEANEVAQIVLNKWEELKK